MGGSPACGVALYLGNPRQWKGSCLNSRPTPTDVQSPSGGPVEPDLPLPSFAEPVDLHPRFLIRGSLENRAEVAEALENPRVPAYVEVRPEDAVPPEDRRELVLRSRE